MESSGPAGSGILNSDSQILKVVGYQMGEDASGKKLLKKQSIPFLQ